MENKYYTPTIEEFHVGFEFEKLYDDWGKLTYVSGHTDKFQEDIDAKIIRVKCLDVDDIKSLDFELITSGKGVSYDIYSNDDITLYGYLDGTIGLSITEKNTTVNGNIMFNQHPVFRGKIKNKSELKKILNQVK